MRSLLISTYNKNVIGLNLLLVILFIVWPFGAFILSTITFRNKFSRIIFILFWGLWGFSRNLISTHDSTVWTFEFMRYTKVTFQEFAELKIKTLGTESTDFLYSFFLFLVSKITSSTAWFWLINSILFLLVYTKCYTAVLKKTSLNNIYLFTLFILFIFFIPQTAYGVRFWYAALIYIYSVIKIIIYNKQKYLFLLILAPLIHFSFFIGLAAYIYFHFTHYHFRPKFYLSIIVFIAVISGFIIQFSTIGDSYSNFSAFEQKIDGYGETSDRSESYASQSTFLNIDRLLFTLYSLFIVISMRSKKVKNKLKSVQSDYGLNNFNYFLMVFFSSLLFFVNFPDVLARFSIVFTLMTILYFIRLYITNKDSSIYLNNLTLFAMLFWGFHLLVNFRRSLGVADINLFKGSLISIMTGSPELAIIF